MGLARGSIVWAVVPDPRGANPKRRPLVIVTSPDDAQPAKPVVGVAISSTATDPAPPDCVELPWHPQGRTTTGLRKRSVAVCTWFVRLRPDDVEASAKYVPPDVVAEIIRRLPAL